MTAWHGAMIDLLVASAATASSAVGIVQPSPIPPPLEQQTADCVRPVFATDQLVCSAPDLRQLDRDLAAALATFPIQTSSWLEPQSQWFLRRSRCAFQSNHGACVRQAYQERRAVLGPALPSSRFVTAVCSDPRVSRVAFEGERTVLFDARGLVIGVGQPLTRANGWTPYLSVTRSGRRMQATTVAGATLRCRLRHVR
jgi:uncharacterized protein